MSGLRNALEGRYTLTRTILESVLKSGIDPFYEAMAKSAFDEVSAVLSALERGVEKRSDWMYSIGTQPWFKAYHGNPRFAALLKQMNL